MSKENLEELIGKSATQGVGDMGGVMSRVVRAACLTADGKLTPEEGLESFRWAVRTERKIEEANPVAWKKYRQDVGGTLLRDDGEKWFKQYANQFTGKGSIPPYHL